jgi:DNA topoisomerase-1
VINDPKASKEAKTAAASALTQKPDKAASKPKAKAKAPAKTKASPAAKAKKAA